MTELGGGTELPLEFGDPRLQQTNLVDHQPYGGTQQVRDVCIGIGKYPGHLLQAEATALRDGNAELPAEASQGIDPRGAGGHPQGTCPVQTLQRLLFDGLDADRSDVGDDGNGPRSREPPAVGQ